MAEKITVKCEKCGRQFSAPSDLAGQLARCKCGEVIAVPLQLSEEQLNEKWYYSKDGEQVGPVPLRELREMIQKGDLKPETQVWTQDLGDWQPAEGVEVFADVTARVEEATAQQSATPAAEAEEAAEKEEAEAKAARESEAKAPEKTQETQPQTQKTQTTTTTKAAKKPTTETKQKTAQQPPQKQKPAQTQRASRPAAQPAARRSVPGGQVPELKFAKMFGIILMVLGVLGIVGGIIVGVMGVVEERMPLFGYLAGGIAVVGLFCLIGSVLVNVCREIALGVWTLGVPVED